MATVILTIALVAIAELMAITLRMQMLGRNQTSATRMAQDKIDQLMSINFNDADPAIAAPVGVGGSLTADVANHFDSDDLNLYKRRWLVQAFPDDQVVVDSDDPDDKDKLRLLTVRVTPVVTDFRTTAPAEIVTVIRCWQC